jgi:hypothetical protein
MKRHILIAACFILPSLLFCQDELTAHLQNAETEYKAGNLQEARFELEQSLAELDILVAKAILEKLPLSVENLNADPAMDEFAGSTLGFTGLFVERTYISADGTQTLRSTILTNPALLGSLNGFLSNPLIASMSGRKVVKINGYKASLERIEGSDPVTFEIQLPFNQSIWTFHFEGIDDQNKVTGLAGKLPVKDVIAIAQ